ncbi:hypothetical protein ACFQS1_37145 [Paractinoplanes rhizophilus]|uniref:Uncharacterized protein n=1 Tax=Paractinoplanes rhizophilus TaxID=1416877 RepID=A0ABW2I4A1_9ACTN
MSTTIQCGAATIEILHAGPNGPVPGQVTVRINGNELTGRPDQLAELGRLLYHELGNVTLPGNTWQILAVGDALTGLAFYGPFPADDPGERAFARIRRLEIDELPYVQADLHSLDELTPIEPDPDLATGAIPPTADITAPGVGTLEAETTYIVIVANGAPASAYAMIGRELVEAYEFHDDGTPDWSTGSICDPNRGDADFYFPATALLRHLTGRDLSNPLTWDHTIRAELDAAFDKFGKARLLAEWSHDADSDGYRSVVWQQNGTVKTVLLVNPGQARAFIDGIQAAVNARALHHRGVTE